MKGRAGGGWAGGWAGGWGHPLTRRAHRYTLTEGDFHHLKNARLTHLHLPPPALKIVTIHECESSENSLAMTPRLPPPKPGLAIFQVSPPPGSGHGAGMHLGGSGRVVGVRVMGCGGPRPRCKAPPLSELCPAAPRGGPAAAGAAQPRRVPQLGAARGHLQLHRGHQLHRGQPLRLL